MRARYDAEVATVQVRDLDDGVLERLKEQASDEGVTLSAFLRRELGYLAERGTVRARWRKLYVPGPPVSREDILDAIHSSRE